MITIYHNPRCSKSREGLQVVKESQKEFAIHKYLEETLSIKELTDLIQKLGIKPIELVRKNETIWKEKFKHKQLTDSEIISAMVSFPKLIERPIVVFKDKAVIGRPTEHITTLINH